MPGAPVVYGDPLSTIPSPPPVPGAASARVAPPKPAPPVEKPFALPPEFQSKSAVTRISLSGLTSFIGTECRPSPDGRYLFVLTNNTGLSFSTLNQPLLYFDLKTGRYGEWAKVSPVSTLAFSTNGRIMLLGHSDGSLTLWSLATRTLLQTIDGPAGPLPERDSSGFGGLAYLQSLGGPQRFPVTAAALDGLTLFTAYGDGQFRFLTLTLTLTPAPQEKPQPVLRLPAGAWFDEVAFSTKGQCGLIGAATSVGQAVDGLHGAIDPANIKGAVASVQLLAANAKTVRTFLSKFPSRGALAFTPDGKSALLADGTSVSAYDSATGEKQFDLPDSRLVRRLAVSADGSRLLTATVNGEVIFWDLPARKPLWKLPTMGAGRVVSLGFLSAEHRLFVGFADGASRFLDAASGQWLATLVVQANMSWAVAAADGRFDTSGFDSTQPLQWLVSDAPLKPLSIEMFMRDYYEPGLLPRLLAGERLPPLRGIGQLNRLLPEVRVTAVTPEPDGKDEVRVRVEIVETRDPASGAASGAQNLRLFRNGRLVSRLPREDGPIPLTGGKAAFEFRHLRDSGHRFSVYAFNRDGVKTPTHEYTLSPASGSLTQNNPGAALFGSNVTPPLPTGRAWVVNVAVGASAVPALNLRFAANDALRLRDDLSREFSQSGQFKQVVQVPLISDPQHPLAASKAALRKLLADLASGGEHPALPSDLLVISFSGHGYSGQDGRFYLIPSDAGQGLSNPLASGFAALLAQSISSDELSLWLQDVDAGQIALILDTCQSAASVQNEGFRPGPLGNRGLGQLAYDKGLVILVASQAESVALESEKLQQGLLTYALTRDGLELARADWQPRDGKIGLIEWLRYAVDRVPALWREVTAGRIQGAPATRVVLNRGAKLLSIENDPSQQPILFDFSHLQSESLIHHAPPAADRRTRAGGDPAGVTRGPAPIVTDYTTLDRPPASALPPPPANRATETGIVATNPRDGLPYVWIPAGSFSMGCSPNDAACTPQERPAHRVTLTSGFWMGRTPVTQQAYQRLMGSNPSRWEGATLPVEQVYRREAAEYCAAAGMRLPTEAEWEYAARAGTTAPLYADADAVAWHRNNSLRRTHSVGEKLPNAFGLFDMLGNVTHWVSDGYGVYDSQDAVDPHRTTGTYGTVRGQSASVDPKQIRVSARVGQPVEVVFGSGFRCAGQ